MIAEFGEQRREHLDAVQERIEDQRRLRLFAIELFDQIAAERRLARARLAGHEHEAFAIVDAVQELAFRFAILLRVEDEPRIRRQRERLVGEAVKLLVHCYRPASWLAADDRRREEDDELTARLDVGDVLEHLAEQRNVLEERDTADRRVPFASERGRRSSSSRRRACARSCRPRGAR